MSNQVPSGKWRKYGWYPSRVSRKFRSVCVCAVRQESIACKPTVPIRSHLHGPCPFARSADGEELCTVIPVSLSTVHIYIQFLHVLKNNTQYCIFFLRVSVRESAVNSVADTDFGAPTPATVSKYNYDRDTARFWPKLCCTADWFQPLPYFCVCYLLFVVVMFCCGR